MSPRVDPDIFDALRMHQPTAVTTDDIETLRTGRDRKRAIKQMGRTWGSEAATSLMKLQDAQIELGRVLVAGTPDSKQRDAVIEARRRLDRAIEARRREAEPDPTTLDSGGVLDRIFRS